jgi:predicted nucleotidyltransferase
MAVVEKDEVIHGLLKEELQRCLAALAALESRLPAFPKGALNVRKKAQQGKQYTYHYLVHREAGRVVNRHVPGAELPALRKQLAERDKYRKEVRAYKKRTTYLERLLAQNANHRHREGKDCYNPPTRGRGEAMDKRLDEIKKSVVPLLRSHGVRKAAVFGSFARGEAGRDSDLDLLIDIGEEFSLLDIIGLRLDLEERLACRVDLVEYDAIKPAIRDRVLSEQVRIL